MQKIETQVDLRSDTVTQPTAAMRQAMLAVVIRTPLREGAKLDAKTLMRIQREYLDRVQSGEKYGAQTQLAQRYGVSVVTLRKALKLLGSR